MLITYIIKLTNDLNILEIVGLDLTSFVLFRKTAPVLSSLTQLVSNFARSEHWHRQMKILAIVLLSRNTRRSCNLAWHTLLRFSVYRVCFEKIRLAYSNMASQSNYLHTYFFLYFKLKVLFKKLPMKLQYGQQTCNKANKNW